MPGLRVFGQRLAFVAGDDLRGIAKIVLVLRILQAMLAWTPTVGLLWLLEATDDNVAATVWQGDNESVAGGGLIDQSDNTTSLSWPCSERNRKDQQTMHLLWSFCVFSAFTIFSSILLESIIFCISSRGSPVQVERRLGLSLLCAVKLVPLTLIRCVTVGLAIVTLQRVPSFCRHRRSVLTSITGNATTINGTLVAYNNDCYLYHAISDIEQLHTLPLAPKEPVCPTYTITAMVVLASTHIVEMSVLGCIALVLLWKRAQSQNSNQQTKCYQWLFTIRFPCGCGYSAGHEPPPRQHLPPYKWHSRCHCCCMLTSCCTCGLFGGCEVLQQSKSAVLRTSSTYWSSSLPTGCSPKRNDKVDATEAATNTSALSDISIMLADYLDTGPEGTLDVTPTDLLVGLSVLRLEQQALKEERLAIQSDESKAVKTANGQRAANTSDQQRHTHHREPVGFVNAPFLGYEVDIESGRAVVVAKSVATGSFQGGPTHKVPSLNRECCQSSTQSLIFSRSCSSVQADFSVCLRPRLDRQNASDRAAIFEGLHHVRLAIAIYGYMFYLLQHKCTAPCCLLVGCLNCRPRADESRKRDSHAPQRPTIVGDNSCGCNELTFLHLAGLKREDIAYMSFKSGLQVSPYGIVLDRSRQEVVIAIRGTFSLEATVTDLNVRPQLLGEYSDRYQVFGKDSLSSQYCHSGMLRCALEIFDDLERHKILEQLLLGKIPQCPGYKLVITGHSLGAGIASILSIMLVDQFQGLRCLCFCPPGCVMSLQACEQDYITSYVHGADIVPRLSFHSMVGLCNDILETIARIKEPKHVALALDASRKKASRLPTLLHPRGSIPDSAFYRRICVFRKHQQRIALTRIEYRVQLHIPGVIVHITESLSVAGGKKAESFAHKNPPFTTSYIPMWANRTDFSEIQLTRTMTSDHDAERLFSILKILAASFQ